MEALLACVNTSTVTVQQQCLTLIGYVILFYTSYSHLYHIIFYPVCILYTCSGVAKVAGADFAPYYPSFMPGIKALMHHALGPDQVCTYTIFFYV